MLKVKVIWNFAPDKEAYVNHKICDVYEKCKLVYKLNLLIIVIYDKIKCFEAQLWK